VAVSKAEKRKAYMRKRRAAARAAREDKAGQGRGSMIVVENHACNDFKDLGYGP
jgi:hypothetical protein